MTFVRVLNCIDKISLDKLANPFIVLQVVLQRSLLHLKDVDQILKTLFQVLFQVKLSFRLAHLYRHDLQEAEKAIIFEDLFGCQLVVHEADLVEELQKEVC